MPIWSARAGADGAHLTGMAAFTAALEQLKPERIAGVGGLATRHDAMVAAEAGADYVMFGEPDAAGERPAFDAIEERIAWWAEVFEAPCVGYAAVDRRGRAAGEGRRRFRRARRLALARPARRSRRRLPHAAGQLRLPETRGMSSARRSTIVALVRARRPGRAAPWRSRRTPSPPAAPNAAANATPAISTSPSAPFSAAII